MYEYKGGLYFECIYEYLNNKNDVNIVDAPYFKAIKSLTSFDDDQLCWIAINNKAITSEREELCILEEERAHYDVGIIPTNCFSNSYADKLSRERNEYRAKRKAVERLVPRDKLLNVMKNLPCIYVDALADAFEVTTDFMLDALKVYGYELVY